MKRKTYLNWKIAVLALFLLGAGAWFAYKSYADKPTYEYLKVERGPLRVTLRESATVQPEHRLTVTPPIPGRIDSINVSNGESVKQGQILAWISSTDRAALMDSARAAGGKEIAFWEDVYKPAPLIASHRNPGIGQHSDHTPPQLRIARCPIAQPIKLVRETVKIVDRLGMRRKSNRRHRCIPVRRNADNRPWPSQPRPQRDQEIARRPGFQRQTRRPVRNKKSWRLHAL